MKQWAHQVEHLNVRCAECWRIARRIIRGEPLLCQEKTHIKQDMTGAREALNARVRDGIESRYTQHMSKHREEASEKKAHVQR
jgi:hypothetical protein